MYYSIQYICTAQTHTYRLDLVVWGCEVLFQQCGRLPPGSVCSFLFGLWLGPLYSALEHEV